MSQPAISAHPPRTQQSNRSSAWPRVEVQPRSMPQHSAVDRTRSRSLLQKTQLQLQLQQRKLDYGASIHPGGNWVHLRRITSTLMQIQLDAKPADTPEVHPPLIGGGCVITGASPAQLDVECHGWMQKSPRRAAPRRYFRHIYCTACRLFSSFSISSTLSSFSSARNLSSSDSGVSTSVAAAFSAAVTCTLLFIRPMVFS